jgi:hypothetical protein
VIAPSEEPPGPSSRWRSARSSSGFRFAVHDVGRDAFGGRNLQTSPEVLRITVLVANGSDECFQREHAERVGQRDRCLSDFVICQAESRRHGKGRST